MIDERKDRRYNTILRGVVESIDSHDDAQLEYWVQTGRKALGLNLSAPNLLDVEPFETVIEDVRESTWIMNFDDENTYGYYIYFIRLSNKQASFTIDQRGWVKTPIFLRAGMNRGIYLDVTQVPAQVSTSISLSGLKFIRRQK